jgi:hypothetical protein
MFSSNPAAFAAQKLKGGWAINTEKPELPKHGVSKNSRNNKTSGNERNSRKHSKSKKSKESYETGQVMVQVTIINDKVDHEATD